MSDKSPMLDPLRPTGQPVRGNGVPDGTEALDPWDGKRAWDLAQDGSLAALSELIDRHFGDHCRIRVEVDENLFQPLAQWDVLGPSESRIRVGTRDGSQRRIRLHWRSFDLLPLFAAYHRGGAPISGSVMLSLEDGGVVPGLAFCDSRPDYFLIPDAIFIATRGYDQIRNVYARDNILWTERSPAIFWRGHDFGPNGCDWHDLPRVKLCSIAAEGAHRHLFDVGMSPHRGGFGYDETKASSLVKDIVPVRLFNRYRYHIDVDGRTNSWPGLFQKLLSGSPILKVTSAGGYRQWYYDRLNAWQHYVPVAADMSDLIEKAEWLRSHDEEAQAIGAAGQALARSMTFDTELSGSVDTVVAAMTAHQAMPTSKGGGQSMGSS
jgi:hypothetical protein